MESGDHIVADVSLANYRPGDHDKCEATDVPTDESCFPAKAWAIQRFNDDSGVELWKLTCDEKPDHRPDLEFVTSPFAFDDVGEKQLCDTLKGLTAFMYKNFGNAWKPENEGRFAPAGLTAADPLSGLAQGSWLHWKAAQNPLAKGSHFKPAPIQLGRVQITIGVPLTSVFQLLSQLPFNASEPSKTVMSTEMANLLIEEVNFLPLSPEDQNTHQTTPAFRSFLAILLLYLQSAQSGGVAAYPKAVLTILSRNKLSDILAKVPEFINYLANKKRKEDDEDFVPNNFHLKSAAQLTTIVLNYYKALKPESVLTKDSKFFSDGWVGCTVDCACNPTIGKYIEGLFAGKDLLTDADAGGECDYFESMGKLPLDSILNQHHEAVPVVIIEFRFIIHPTLLEGTHERRPLEVADPWRGSVRTIMMWWRYARALISDSSETFSKAKFFYDPFDSENHNPFGKFECTFDSYDSEHILVWFVDQTVNHRKK